MPYQPNTNQSASDPRFPRQRIHPNPASCGECTCGRPGHLLAEALANRCRQEGSRAVLHLVDVMIDRFERHAAALGAGRGFDGGHIAERALSLAADAEALGQPQPALLARDLQTALALGRKATVDDLVADVHAETRRILGWLRLWRALNTRTASYVRFTLG